MNLQDTDIDLQRLFRASKEYFDNGGMIPDYYSNQNPAPLFKPAYSALENLAWLGEDGQVHTVKHENHTHLRPSLLSGEREEEKKSP